MRRCPSFLESSSRSSPTPSDPRAGGRRSPASLNRARPPSASRAGCPPRPGSAAGPQRPAGPGGGTRSVPCAGLEHGRLGFLDLEEDADRSRLDRRTAQPRRGCQRCRPRPPCGRRGRIGIRPRGGGDRCRACSRYSSVSALHLALGLAQLDAGEQLVEWHEDRRIAGDTKLAVDAMGELPKGAHAVLALRLGNVAARSAFARPCSPSARTASRI